MKLPPRLEQWRALAEAIAAYYQLDPALILAVIDRESLGGEALTPKGPAGTGDHGYGTGLMQIDKRAHAFATCTDDAGRPLTSDPWLNISYGARLLRRLLDTFAGDVAAALAAYNAGAGRVRRALSALSPEAPLVERVKVVNALTTGGDYVSDVLRRRDSFAG